MKKLLNRREFMAGTASMLALTCGAGPGLLSLGGCSKENSAYQSAIARMTAPLPANPETTELIRFATLAGNGHNTQPWKFKIRDKYIDILPDLSRRTPVVDPDDHHLYASLGCAMENLALAARARGMRGDITFDNAGEGRLIADLSPVRAKESALFEAITHRQCTRSMYDGSPAPRKAIERIIQAAALYDVDALYISEKPRVEDMLELVIEGNSRQMDDPAFVQELKDWIRFNPSAAAITGDGLYTVTSGNPVMPTWFGSLLFEQFFVKEAENKKYTDHIRSSSGILVFVAKSDDRKGWVNAGRAYQRAALQATADGLKHAFINQAVEVPEMRRKLQDLLKLGTRRPNLVIRIGYAEALPKSLRRPVREVLT